MAGVAVRGDVPRPGLHHSGSLFVGALPLLVTSNAVVHRERLERARRRADEALHRPMARLALHLRHRDVGPMGEKDVGGEPPDALPRDLLALLTEASDLLHFFALGLSSRVAGKAERCGRAACDVTLLRTLMAARTREFQLFHVRLVRIFDRLPDGGFDPPEAPRQEGHGNHPDDSDPLHLGHANTLETVSGLKRRSACPSSGGTLIRRIAGWRRLEARHLSGTWFGE